MPKAKQLDQIPPTFKDFLEKFEPTALQAAVGQLEGSISWELMRAFLRTNQRLYEVAALDLVKHSGKSHEAANASGYAQACEDVADRFMQDLKDSVNGKSALIEGPERDQE